MADHQPLPIEADRAVDAHRVIPAPPPAPEFLDAEFREVPPRRLLDYLRVVFKHRRLAAACFVGCIALAALITVLTPRAYTASAQIQVARTSPIKLQLKETVLDLDETERILNGVSSFLSTQVETLRSRDIADRAIRTFHLAENPDFAEPEQDGAAQAAVSVSLPALLQPRGLPEPDPSAAARPPDDGPVAPELLDRYMRYLSVEDVRGTDLIEVRFTAPTPTLAAFLTAAHIQAYLDSVKESQVVTDSAAKAFLAQQLAESRQRVDSSGATLADFSAAHPEVAVSQEDQLISKQVSDLILQLGEAERRRAATQSRYEVLASSKGDALQHLIDESQEIPKLRIELLDVQSQITSLAQRLGPNHTQMRALRQEEAETRQQITTEVKQQIAAAHARYRTAQLQEDELRTRLAALETKAADLRALAGQYDLLKVERDNARALHESLLKQQTETAVHSELAASNIRVIERPEVPRWAARPRKILNLAGGALAGILLAIGAAFFRESLDTSVKSSDEAEELLQLPTLAIIPNFGAPRSGGFRLRGVSGILAARRQREAARADGDSGAGESRELVVLQEPKSPVSESFRMLRTALLLSSTGVPPQMILVTSAASGEGKTVTALNLASTLADTGRRVLLIDVDMRHPGCHAVLGSAQSPGLSNYLAGEVALEDAIQEIASPNLAFLAAGPTPANPAELIGCDRMRDALALLRTRFDFIILDSPPVLPVTDAVLLAHRADAAVLVMNGRKSPREFVRRARDQLVQVGGNVIGVVVNNAGPDWGSAYLYSYDRDRRAPAAPEVTAV